MLSRQAKDRMGGSREILYENFVFRNDIKTLDITLLSIQLYVLLKLNINDFNLI